MRAAALLRRGQSRLAVVAGPKPTVPTSTSLFGMVSENTAQTHAQSWAADVATLGRTPDYQSFYYHTSDPFPVADTTASTPAAPALMITWFGWPDSEVNSGSHDAAITTRAQALAAIGRPVFLRWDIEMNITSYGYEPTGGAASGGPSFISAWQRVWNLFQAAGATNVAFVWCPNSNSPFDPNSWRAFYPGDAYVDWVALDAYNFGNSTTPAGSAWQTMYQVSNLFVTDYKAGFGGLMTTQKPLMVGEGSSVEGGGDKSWWYTDLSGYLRTNGFKGYTLYNTNQSSSGNNYRFDSSAQAAQAMKEIVADPYFGGSSTVGSGYAAAVAADTPYAWWKLGETSGSFADSSGNGFAGTAVSTVTRGCVTKWPGAGYGLSWYGSGYADLGTVGTFGSSIGAGATIEFLFKAERSGGNGTILGLLNTGTSMGLNIQANTNHLGASAGSTYFWTRNAAGTQRYSDVTTNIYDGAWHHIVWVIQPGTTNFDVIYIDGAVATTGAQTKPALGTYADYGFSLYVGGENGRGSIQQTSIGVMSNLALYKSALSPTRAAAHWTALTT